MTAHTQGPWTLETVPTSVGICHKIGQFPGRSADKPGYACVYVDGWGRGHAEAELLANAHLMTAAPELLDGCRALLGLLELVAGRPDISAELRAVLTSGHRIEEALAAIAKATGGQS